MIYRRPAAVNPGYPVFPGSTVPGSYEPWDDYAIGANVETDGLNLGYSFFDQSFRWDSAWISRPSLLPSDLGEETFNTYTVGDEVDGLAGGFRWDGDWIERFSFLPTDLGHDTFDTYTITDPLNGLNGGHPWDGAWIVR